MTPDERFDAKVIPEPNSGCHLWLGAVNNDGYGHFSVDGKKVLAHRFAFARANGSIADGLVIRHTCDVRCCVNEQHLIPGTHADNANDKVVRGRSASWCCSLRSSIEKQDVGDQGDAENDRRDARHFDAENPSWVKCHAPSWEAVERQR
jgi:hypothetical protein